MKALYLTDEIRADLAAEFVKYLAELDDRTVVKFERSVPRKMDRITIFYTPQAYAKSVQLVNTFDTEIAWHCLVKRCEGGFLVYDVLVYPQNVYGANIHTDMEKYATWKIDLTDDQDANLFGQCHSHVNMDTFASDVDMKQQEHEISLKGRKGFYLFQIWNKRLNINTFLYDLDNNVLYEKDDVDIVVDYDNVTSDKFLAEAKRLAKGPDPAPVTYLKPPMPETVYKFLERDPARIQPDPYLIHDWTFGKGFKPAPPLNPQTEGGLSFEE